MSEPSMNPQARPIRPMDVLTNQEALYLYGTPSGEDMYRPKSYLSGRLSKEEVVAAREDAYLINPSSVQGWQLRKKFAGTALEGDLRIRLQPVNPETMETVGDPVIELGKVDKETGEFTFDRDVTEEFVQDYKEDYPDIDLHLRGEGKKGPEGNVSGGPEGGY